MSLRIGNIEIQQIYLGTTPVTEIFLDNTDVVTPSTGFNLLQENGSALLTELGYNLLLDRRPLLMTESEALLITEGGDYLTVEAT
jgi:hypothetical protein